MTERSLDVAQSPIEQQYGPVALLAQGAEARVWTGVRDGVPIVIKERFAKTYRHTDLDAKLTRRRTKTEVKCLARCAGLSNVKVPAVLGVDFACARIFLEFMQAPTVKTYINSLPADGTDARIRLAEKLGVAVAEMHSNNVVHGDLTSSNILVRDDGELVLIDFGLAYVSHLSEDKAVDLYVLERALLATHPDFTEVFAVTLESYQAHAAESARVMTRFEKVRLRGRKRSMIG
ncbi:non-specific serine/threonine protein kinase [Plasmodiophora brassicae]|uniref:non-specific serine/threonine protein kinase n=1 Tax=Plasmodiophora brassicae TaxID=37360 RepID=A0A0G4IGK2_PLABS|nr:hypothetical protein PBRA_000094 [Plasmodiophora brassicae]